jgi:hypothetical protein
MDSDGPAQINRPKTFLARNAHMYALVTNEGFDVRKSANGSTLRIPAISWTELDEILALGSQLLKYW